MPKDIVTIQIKDLRLRTYIGFNPDEQQKKQDVIVNVWIEYDAHQAMHSDNVSDGFNYKILTKKIIATVEEHRFNLLERMGKVIMQLIKQERQIISARLLIDKPHALRFADSVSVELNYTHDT